MVVKQAEQEIEFNNKQYSGDSFSEVIKGEFPDTGKTYDFSAKDVKAVAGGSFTYSVENTAENEGEDGNE